MDSVKKINNIHKNLLFKNRNVNHEIIIHNISDLRKNIHNIKNLHPLTRESIDEIRNMSDEDKMKIILTYNDTFEWLLNIIEKTL